MDNEGDNLMEIIREIDDNVVIKKSDDVKRYLQEFIKEDREYLIVLGLDSKNKVLYREIAGIGTLNTALIHPREVYKKAIITSANSIIIAHNHPSGDTTPSKEDIHTKKELKKAGKIIGIPLLDFIIIGKNTR